MVGPQLNRSESRRRELGAAMRNVEVLRMVDSSSRTNGAALDNAPMVGCLLIHGCRCMKANGFGDQQRAGRGAVNFGSHGRT